MNTWKLNLEETKKHYVDWWNHKGIVLNMWEHFQEGVTPHADVPMPPAPKDLNQKWFDPQWRAEYLDWYVAHSCLKADMLPVANTQLGPGSLAAILGGVFEGGEDTIWIHPNPDYTDEIIFDRNHPNWLLHKELLKACKAKAQGHYYIGMPDLMEGMDVLAAMKGTDKVLLDTVMQPEVLEHQMQQINDIYFQVFDELYDIIREGDEMAFCYFSAWAPGKMAKLQSDISTMISVDDYRRFVQPFIRQQCQRLDYSLYHLDGVGATHHLPALLEIEELNAIQWTPGVGEPQGGSPKWYDLYKKILGAGKSIMACWVTLDELRPLLDNIGCDGVHIEMDFHNEDEVEQAMRIVEEYRDPSPALPRGGSVNDPIVINRDLDAQVQAIINKVEAEFAERKGSEENEGAKERGHDSCPCGFEHGVHGVNGSNGQHGNNDVHGSTIASPLGGRLERASSPSLTERAREGLLLILDGGMGTMIQQYQLREEDFRGSRFIDHAGELKGCNDLLSMTSPFVVREVHRRYLEAGADIITTNTFNAQRVSMGDWGMQDYCRDINLAACKIARETADEFTKKTPQKPRFVAGSMGPTNKTCSMSTGSGEPLSQEVLSAAYQEQAEALVEGGVDVILIETIFDTLNAELAIKAALKAMEIKGREVPLMLSFNVASPEGVNLLGQHIPDFIVRLTTDNPSLADHIFSVGINCLPEVSTMIPVIEALAARTHHRISIYPNAGKPDGKGGYTKSPAQLQADLWPLVQYHMLNIIGGCCGTTDEHIRKIAEMVEPIEGLFMAARDPKKGNVGSVGTRERENAQPSTLNPQQTPSPWGRQRGGELCSGWGRGGVFSAILAGKGAEAAEATKEAIAAGQQPQDIINGQMIRAMGEVGQRFQDGKAFVPQLLMAGRAMKAALEILKPLMAGTSNISLGKVVIGTVKGDLHDIGKNLVASMLEGCGFEVVNIGIDVSADTFIDEIRKNKPDILCMSALLTTTMGYMKEVIDALKEAGLRDQVKVMVGGAPVSQAFANEIGADGYSDNANTAVAVAKQLLGVK